jgi:hypothetical protein
VLLPSPLVAEGAAAVLLEAGVPPADFRRAAGMCPKLLSGHPGVHHAHNMFDLSSVRGVKLTGEGRCESTQSNPDNQTHQFLAKLS